MDPLLTEIEAFCIAQALSEWQFGELALKDRKFVGQLRAGRDIRRSTIGKVRTFMASYAPAARAA